MANIDIYDIPEINQIATPKYVGMYKVDRFFSFSLAKKPNWFHRKMVKLILGWEWQDDGDTAFKQHLL